VYTIGESHSDRNIGTDDTVMANWVFGEVKLTVKGWSAL